MQAGGKVGKHSGINKLLMIILSKQREEEGGGGGEFYG
jgi:hypothetical protein